MGEFTLYADVQYPHRVRNALATNIFRIPEQKIRVIAGDVGGGFNPLGTKGAGEARTVGAFPAVINALLDALAPLGVREFDMPATRERVWQAIQAARGTA